MPKLRMVLQALLGILLAFALIFSPLKNPTVVFSARSEEEIPPPQEPSPEAVVNDPVFGQPVDEPGGGISPDEENPSPAPIISDGYSAANTNPGDQAQSTEPAESLVTEVTAGDGFQNEAPAPPVPNAALTIEPTGSPEIHQPVDETQPVIQPTAQEQTIASGGLEQPGLDEEIQTTNTMWLSGQVVLRFDPSIPMEEQIARLTAQGLEITATEPNLGVLVVQVPAGMEEESVIAISAMDGIQYAEPVYTASALDVTPNDTYFSNQGDMLTINAPGGWQYYTGSSGVIIAIIDSGVDLSHPDLAGKIIQGWDFVNNDDTAQDDFGHGTHVAGIAAASGNNSTGIAGLDWSAKILPIKVLNNAGFGSAVNIALGIRYAVDHGAKIINLSLGLTTNSALIEDAVNYAYQHGVTIIASTGNTNGAVTYPAALPQVIAVGAVDNSGNRWASSNFGSEVDLVAPGVAIYSTDPSGYATRTGTSMAAAHVSGLAALLEGIKPLTPVQVKKAMTSTSRDLGTAGWDVFFGNGLIQVRDAILKLFNSLFPVQQKEPQGEIPTVQFISTYTPTPTSTPTPTPGMS